MRSWSARSRRAVVRSPMRLCGKLRTGPPTSLDAPALKHLQSPISPESRQPAIPLLFMQPWSLALSMPECFYHGRCFPAVIPLRRKSSDTGMAVSFRTILTPARPCHQALSLHVSMLLVTRQCWATSCRAWAASLRPRADFRCGGLGQPRRGRRSVFFYPDGVPGPMASCLSSWTCLRFSFQAPGVPAKEQDDSQEVAVLYLIPPRLWA